MRRSAALTAAPLAAALAAAAPTSAGAALPTGIPAGLVQHGSYEVVVSGARARPSHVRVLFWVTADQWRSSVRDAGTGRFEFGTVYDGARTTYYAPGRGRESFEQDAHEPPPPLPGFTPVEAGRLIARKHALPAGTEVVAGIPGVRYPLPDAPGTLTLTVAPGTLAPLERVTTGRDVEQRETMLATATDTDPTALRSVAPATLRTTVGRWRRATRR